MTNNNTITSQDCDRLLGLADQFLEDWAVNAQEDQDFDSDRQCLERKAEFDKARPLMVTAPDLLAALEAILSPFNYGDKIEMHKSDDQYHAARAAIAKAKGAKPCA